MSELTHSPFDTREQSAPTPLTREPARYFFGIQNSCDGSTVARLADCDGDYVSYDDYADQRLTIEQQAQEIEWLKQERAVSTTLICRKCGGSCTVTIEYGRPVDGRDAEITKWRSEYKNEVIKRCSVQAEREELKQQLAASQARCELQVQYNAELIERIATLQARVRELEANLDHWREEAAHLQATLAERARRIEELEGDYVIVNDQRKAAVQEAGQLREALKDLLEFGGIIRERGGDAEVDRAQRALKGDV